MSEWSHLAMRLQRQAAVLRGATCPDCKIKMTPTYGPLVPGENAPQGLSWKCPRCKMERMWPDKEDQLKEVDATEPILWQLGNIQQQEFSGVTTSIRPLYHNVRGQMIRVGDIKRDYAERVLRALEGGSK